MDIKVNQLSDSQQEVEVNLNYDEILQEIEEAYKEDPANSAAKNYYSAIGAWLLMDDAEFGSNLATCRAALGEAAFRAAAEQGRAMTTDEAIAFALEQSVA